MIKGFNQLFSSAYRYAIQSNWLRMVRSIFGANNRSPQWLMVANTFYQLERNRGKNICQRCNDNILMKLMALRYVWIRLHIVIEWLQWNRGELIKIISRWLQSKDQIFVKLMPMEEIAINWIISGMQNNYCILTCVCSRI